MADFNFQDFHAGTELGRLEEWIFDKLYEKHDFENHLFCSVAQNDIHSVLWMLLEADHFSFQGAFGNYGVIYYCDAVFETWKYEGAARVDESGAPLRVTKLRIPKKRMSEDMPVPWHTLSRSLVKLDQLKCLEIGDCSITRDLEALQHLETLTIQSSDFLAYPDNPGHVPCTLNALVELSVSGYPQLLSWVAMSNFPNLQSLKVIFPFENMVASTTVYESIAAAFEGNRLLRKIRHLYIAEDTGPASCSVSFVLDTMPTIVPDLKELYFTHQTQRIWGKMCKLMAQRLENGDYDPSLLTTLSKNLTKIEALDNGGLITSHFADRTSTILMYLKSLEYVPRLEWLVKFRKMQVVYYVFINSLGLHFLAPKTSIEYSGPCPKRHRTAKSIPLSVWPHVIYSALKGKAKPLQAFEIPKSINYTVVYDMLRTNTEVFLGNTIS